MESKLRDIVAIALDDRANVVQKPLLSACPGSALHGLGISSRQDPIDEAASSLRMSGHTSGSKRAVPRL